MRLACNLVALTLLAVTCRTSGVAHRFYFPSMTLLLDQPEGSSGHGRRVSGDAPEGSSGSGSPSLGRGQPAAPSQPTPTASKIREPSRCTFAIVGCCRAGSMRVNDMCFDQFQCHGPFWGESPCRTESALAAHNIVSKYYEAKEAEKREQEAAAAAAAAAPGDVASGPRPESEESSPFDPIGPLPSRVDAMNQGRPVGP